MLSTYWTKIILKLFHLFMLCSPLAFTCLHHINVVKFMKYVYQNSQFLPNRDLSHINSYFSWIQHPVLRFFIISALECFLYLLGAHNLSTAMYIFHFTKFAWLTFFPRHTASCAEFFSVMSVLLILAYEIGSFLSALRVFDFFIILEVLNFFPSVCQNCLNIFKQTFHVRIV